VPNFVSVTAPVAEQARGEKIVYSTLTQSLIHARSLFDDPGTESLALE